MSWRKFLYFLIKNNESFRVILKSTNLKLNCKTSMLMSEFKLQNYWCDLFYLDTSIKLKTSELNWKVARETKIQEKKCRCKIIHETKVKVQSSVQWQIHYCTRIIYCQCKLAGPSKDLQNDTAEKIMFQASAYLYRFQFREKAFVVETFQQRMKHIAISTCGQFDTGILIAFQIFKMCNLF